MSDGSNNHSSSDRTGNTAPSSGLRSAGRFVTLGSLGSSGRGGGNPTHGHSHHDDDNDEDDKDSDEDEGQTWFAGGERSGISIENPGHQRSVPGGNTVRDILRQAAQAGPAVAEELRTSAVFRGGGHILGGEGIESSFVPDAAAESETAIRHLTFWRNGFQVEDGELMRYDDPEHATLLTEINSGLAPPSILNVRTGQRVDLRVAKRIQEDYIPPKGARNFEGAGQRLGGIVPGESTSNRGQSVPMPGSFPSGTTTSPRQDSSSETIRSSFAPKFEVDQSQPTTSIQIRLADGTRIVSRMNHTHTVGDIRNFINASRPANVSRSYEIRTMFPKHTLDDESATIEGAGLVNSVVVQHWT